MKDQRKPAYWTVIPAKVRYDKDLRPNAKLLYAEIQALADSSGYCWATNEYLAQLYGLAARTVSDLISKLAQKGYITVEVLRDEETNEVLERRIWVDKPYRITDIPPAKNGRTPHAKNSDTPPAKNGEENNINNLNNIPLKPPKGAGVQNAHPERRRTGSRSGLPGSGSSIPGGRTSSGPWTPGTGSSLTTRPSTPSPRLW